MIRGAERAEPDPAGPAEADGEPPAEADRSLAPDRPSGAVARGPDPSAGARPPEPLAASAASAAAPAWADRALLAACCVAIAFLCAQIATYGYGRDQGIYAMVARSMLDGGMPYRDAWDFKPPGIFVLYALARALFGASQAGIRVLEIAGLLGMVAAMVALAKRWWGAPRIGLLAGALAVLVHAQLDFWHSAQPESFGGMLTMAALLAASVDRSPGVTPRRRALAWLGSGALFGLAGLLKPPLAGGAPIVAAAAALDVWREHAARRVPDRPALAARVRAAALPIAITAAGTLAPIALCAAWFAARGAMRDLASVLFVFTPHYTALSWVGETVTGMLYAGISDWLVTYSSLVTAGVLFMIATRSEPHERRGIAILAALIAVHVVGVTMQGKFFPYHYAATWPPTAMLAALGIGRLWNATARRGPLPWAAYVAALVAITFGRSATKDVPDSYFVRCQRRLTLLASGLCDRAGLDALASVADVNAGANRAVAEWLAAHTPPHSPVFVFGFEPVIYDLADRPPATRFLYDVPQRVEWAREAMTARLMDDLAARPPAAIVVEHRDVFPMVTGNLLDSADSLPELPALERLIAERYELATSIEDFDVYLARSAGDPPSP